VVNDLRAFDFALVDIPTSLGVFDAVGQPLLVNKEIRIVRMIPLHSTPQLA
jgi:hypothetical protein